MFRLSISLSTYNVLRFRILATSRVINIPVNFRVIIQYMLYFESLLTETARRYSRVDLVAGDSGFLSRCNCDLVAGVGTVPRFYPKKNSRLCSRGSRAWRAMLEELTLDPQKWLEEYHKRFNTGGCFSTLKRDNPLPLRKELDERRQQEAFTRACNLNIKRLCYLNHLEGINARETWHK